MNSNMINSIKINKKLMILMIKKSKSKLMKLKMRIQSINKINKM